MAGITTCVQLVQGEQYSCVFARHSTQKQARTNRNHTIYAIASRRPEPDHSQINECKRAFYAVVGLPPALAQFVCLALHIIQQIHPVCIESQRMHQCLAKWRVRCIHCAWRTWRILPVLNGDEGHKLAILIALVPCLDHHGLYKGKPLIVYMLVFQYPVEITQ